jgi:hypothetical protein
MCQPVATMPAHYESREACSAATSAVLAGAMDFDFPTIVAECREAKLPASGRVEPSSSDVRGGRQG